VLINNAGIGAVAPTETLSFERWSRVLAVNLTGPLLCSQAVGRHMLQAGRCVIINIGSIFGEVGMPMSCRVCRQQARVGGLDAGTRSRVGKPGSARRHRRASLGLDEQDQKDGAYSPDDIIGRTPMGRYAEPHEIAATVAFLAGDEASFITGATIAVDGGWLAHGGW